MRLPDDLTAVIAARDEEATIADVVRACRPYARETLVVVHRHNFDRTAARAEEAGARIIVDGGRGKGQALRLAAAEVRTALIMFIDADGSHDTRDIPKLLQPILDGAADHVSASRLTGGSSELHGGFDEFLRLSGSSFITACINWRFGVRLSDSQNGFRAIRTDVFRQLRLSANRTTIEQEMIMKSLALGYRVAEVPSHEYERRSGRSHISVRRAAPAYAFNLLKHLLFAPSAASVRRPAPESRVEGRVPAHNLK
jgi:dolichol-phosphate mannosyltransferase